MDNDTTLLTVRLAGSRKRPVVRAVMPSGQVVAEERVQGSESAEDAHMRLMQRLAEHPRFMGIVDSVGDDVPLKEEEISWDE